MAEAPQGKKRLERALTILNTLHAQGRLMPVDQRKIAALKELLEASSVLHPHHLAV